MNVKPVVLGAATVTRLWQRGDSIRSVVNIGTGLAAMDTSDTVAIGTGWPLAAAGAPGDQGGGYDFGGEFKAGEDMYGVSAVGTTLAVLEG